jgi:hypothetical protein
VVAAWVLVAAMHTLPAAFALTHTVVLSHYFITCGGASVSIAIAITILEKNSQQFKQVYKSGKCNWNLDAVLAPPTAASVAFGTEACTIGEKAARKMMVRVMMLVMVMTMVMTMVIVMTTYHPLKSHQRYR